MLAYSDVVILEPYRTEHKQLFECFLKILIAIKLFFKKMFYISFHPIHLNCLGEEGKKPQYVFTIIS